MLFLDTLENFTRSCDLSGKTWAVLMYILSQSDYGNFVAINQAKISEHVGIARQNVSTAIKKLVEKGMLIKGPKVGTSYTYKLNWEYVWRGTPEAYREQQLETIRDRLSVIK